MIKSIVLIDDNNATNFIHETYLRRVNCAERVHSFTMGKKALDHLMNSQVFPELIFVDINMPTMDAWEFMEIYQDLDTALKINTRVILLTTSIIPSDKEKMELYKEIDAMMFKPLNETAIRQIMTEYFNLTL
ncbi:response regulator [Zobellia amurskyensis]|uniref:Response regulator n=1 Tax=Zobellia amurskyensis TaxID=248905 RepID=A0A7X2ZVG2_9FLAO|nr:response regulator [Zobellia amurskyensis]MUH37094.1 response regulator [Zobellia amurskyensis]